MLQEESKGSASPKLITVDIVHPGPFPPIIIQIVRTFLTAKKRQEHTRRTKILQISWHPSLVRRLVLHTPISPIQLADNPSFVYMYICTYNTIHDLTPIAPYTPFTLSQKSQSSYLRIKTHAQYLYLLSPRPQLIPFPVPHLPFESFHQEMKYGETLQQRSIPLWETCMSTLSIRCHHMFAVLTSQSPR